MKPTTKELMAEINRQITFAREKLMASRRRAKIVVDYQRIIRSLKLRDNEQKMDTNQ